MNYKTQEHGFTIMELMVAMSLNAIILAMVVVAAVSNRDHYLEDSTRTQITSNLRAGLDITVTNTRQAGENLSSRFPAIMLEEETLVSSDILSVRRAILPDVLTLCSAASSGQTSILVSNSSLSDPACVNSVAGNVHDIWEGYRTNAGGSVRIYLWDTVNKIGEFVDYTNGGLSSGDYYLSTSGLSNDYPALNTYVYVLEEYRFRWEEALETLVLNVNGEIDVDQTISFEITDFEVTLDMQDGTSVNNLLPTDSTYDWKDIKAVKLLLTGAKTRAKRTFTFSESTSVFPRNIMSY